MCRIFSNTNIAHLGVVCPPVKALDPLKDQRMSKEMETHTHTHTHTQTVHTHTHHSKQPSVKPHENLMFSPTPISVLLCSIFHPSLALSQGRERAVECPAHTGRGNDSRPYVTPVGSEEEAVRQGQSGALSLSLRTTRDLKQRNSQTHLEKVLEYIQKNNI